MDTYVTFKLMDAGLSEIEDIQKKSLMEFSEYLRKEVGQALEQLSSCSDKNGGINWLQYWELRENKFYFLAFAHQKLDLVNWDIVQLRISKESFGNAGAALAKAGFCEFGELKQKLEIGIKEVKGLGTTKINEFCSILIELLSTLSVEESSRINIDEQVKEFFKKSDKLKHNASAKLKDQNFKRQFGYSKIELLGKQFPILNSLPERTLSQLQTGKKLHILQNNEIFKFGSTLR